MDELSPRKIETKVESFACSKMPKEQRLYELLKNDDVVKSGLS